MREKTKMMINTKQILLSAFVVVSFVIYSLNQKRNGAEVNLNLGQKTSSETLVKNNNMVEGEKTVSKKFKDGRYTGSVADAFYGNIQVEAVINNGEIADVIFLEYPSDRETSIIVNQQAMPILKSEAIRVQSAAVDIVTGATDTSKAFVESLGSALKKAI